MDDGYAAFAENIEKAKAFMADVCVGFAAKWPQGKFEARFRHPLQQGILFDLHLQADGSLAMPWHLPYLPATWPDERRKMWHILRWFKEEAKT